MDLAALYAKQADLHTNGGFLEGLYAERPVLHTGGGISSSLYAESPILHTDRGEQGSRTEVRQENVLYPGIQQAAAMRGVHDGPSAGPLRTFWGC